MSSVEKAAQAHDAALYLLVPISLVLSKRVAIHTNNIHTIRVFYMFSPAVADASERNMKIGLLNPHSINTLAVTRQDSTASG